MVLNFDGAARGHSLASTLLQFSALGLPSSGAIAASRHCTHPRADAILLHTPLFDPLPAVPLVGATPQNHWAEELIRFVSITLHLIYHPVPGHGPPQDYSAWHAWTGFGVVLGTNMVGLLVVMLRRDIVWCIAATWVCVSIWAMRPKPAPVYVGST